jgi:Zn-dependent peptidase ImmA (M78 family)
VIDPRKFKAPYGWVEWQACEFAGRLLVPPDPLRESFQTAVQTAEAAGYADWLAADEAALDYIATRIAPKFGVSAEVIGKRLRVEKLWPPK